MSRPRRKKARPVLIGAGKSVTTSIVLPVTMIAKLKARGAQMGVGYQTLLKIIMSENIDKY